MVLFAAPAIELNVAEHALTGCVAGNQRASVAGPEIFGWDISECDAGAQTRTDRAVQRCVRAENHGFEEGNAIGDFCDAAMQQTAKGPVRIDLTTGWPHHHGGIVRGVFGGHVEPRRHPRHLRMCRQSWGGAYGQGLSKEAAETHGGSIGLPAVKEHRKRHAALI